MHPYIDRLREIFSDPTTYRKEIILIGGFVLGVLLALALAVALILVMRGDRAANQRASVAAGTLVRRRRKPSLRRRIATSSVIAILVLVAFTVAFGATSRTSYCGRVCHSADQAVANQAASTHRSVACVSCHEDPPPSGIVSSALSRVSEAIAQWRGTAAARAAAVPSGRCLRCHEAVLFRTVKDQVTGTKISHKEFVEGGLSCDDCHLNIGHEPQPTTGNQMTSPPARNGLHGAALMALCSRCHDGHTALSDCSLCHTGDPYLAAAAEAPFARVQPQTPNCGGCHPQTTCDKCHGLRMPHTAEFIAFGHAKYGAFDGKALCYRCHANTFCGKCHHTDLSGGHAENWRTAHQKAPPTSSCGCHQSKLPLQLQGHPFCQLCH